jgi:glutamine amidotransferase
MLTIIDMGMGNLGSIVSMMRKIHHTETRISEDPSDIDRAEKLILPGVGSFDTAMKNLDALGLIPVLNQKVQKDRTPILGICLGIQLFTASSEEGILPGLGWIEGETVKFRFGPDQKNLKVPHMGWNTLDIAKNSLLFRDSVPDSRFYFVHSYHVVCRNKQDILTTTNYGYDFVSAIERDNISGTQFHPEKSHKYGMQVLKNFSELV